MREDICKGLFSGGDHGFIQQEGLFWTSDLWDEVDGLDESLRLAGDFDLWRAFCQKTEYYCINTITGCHRKREGQLSGDKNAYQEEVEDGAKEEDRFEGRPSVLCRLFLLPSGRTEMDGNSESDRGTHCSAAYCKYSRGDNTGCEW